MIKLLFCMVFSEIGILLKYTMLIPPQMTSPCSNRLFDPKNNSKSLSVSEEPKNQFPVCSYAIFEIPNLFPLACFRLAINGDRLRHAVSGQTIFLNKHGLI